MQTGALDPQAVQTIVTSLYRLFRVGAFHHLENDAVTLATDDTIRSLSALEKFDRQGITLVFTGDTVIVNGQLLQADPDVYESAMDFSSFLTDIGMNAISIGKAVARTDLRALLELFVDRDSAPERIDERGYLSANIRLRLINPDLLLGLEDDRLSPLDRILLTYALTTLVIRRLVQSVSEGGFELAGYFKRLSRQLSRINYTDRPIVFDVILSRHMTDDEAKRSVNSALLSIAMARQVTSHEISLSRVAMASLLLSVGDYRPRPPQAPEPDDALSTAIVTMAMGELFGDNLERTIIGWEGMRLLRAFEASEGGAVSAELYGDANLPAIESRMVRIARACVEHLIRQPTIDDVLDTLLRECVDALDRACVALLIDAIGVLPRGTFVELENGWRGVVLKAGRKPSQFGRPTVRLIIDERGRTVTAEDIDLSEPAASHYGSVARVLTRPNAVLKASGHTIEAPVARWLEALDEDAHAALAMLEAESDDRGARSMTDPGFDREMKTIATPIIEGEGSAAFDRTSSRLRRATTGGFDRTPSSVSRIHSRDRGDRGAASEFRRRASSASHASIGAAKAAAAQRAPASPPTPSSGSPVTANASSAATAPRATGPATAAGSNDVQHEEAAAGFERVGSAGMFRRTPTRARKQEESERPERLSADVQALLKDFVGD